MGQARIISIDRSYGRRKIVLVGIFGAVAIGLIGVTRISDLPNPISEQSPGNQESLPSATKATAQTSTTNAWFKNLEDAEKYADKVSKQETDCDEAEKRKFRTEWMLRAQGEYRDFMMTSRTSDEQYEFLSAIIPMPSKYEGQEAKDFRDFVRKFARDHLEEMVIKARHGTLNIYNSSVNEYDADCFEKPDPYCTKVFEQYREEIRQYKLDHWPDENQQEVLIVHVGHVAPQVQ